MSALWRWGFVCLLASLAGCGRGAKDPALATAPAPEQASPRGPIRLTEAPPPAPVIQETNDVNATLQELTVALRDYVVRTRSVPKNFEEFASKSQAQFPQPPAGNKYAIKDQQVVLEKR
jgi:hypothetical protein